MLIVETYSNSIIGKSLFLRAIVDDEILVPS